MTYRGVARGRVIELEEPLPLPEGQPIEVQVEARVDETAPGSAKELLRAVKGPPHVDPADVDEMERLIAEGAMPVRSIGAFDPEE